MLQRLNGWEKITWKKGSNNFACCAFGIPTPQSFTSNLNHTVCWEGEKAAELGQVGKVGEQFKEEVDVLSEHSELGLADCEEGDGTSIGRKLLAVLTSPERRRWGDGGGEYVGECRGEMQQEDPGDVIGEDRVLFVLDDNGSGGTLLTLTNCSGVVILHNTYNAVK